MSSAVHTVPAPTRRGGIAERSALQLELRCRGCGYGAVTTRRLLRCPMCGGDDWCEGVNTAR
jgi:rubrerythrin